MFPELSKIVFDGTVVKIEIETPVTEYCLILTALPAPPLTDLRPRYVGSLDMVNGNGDWISVKEAEAELSDAGLQQVYALLKEAWEGVEAGGDDDLEDDDDYGEGRQMAGMAYGNQGLADYGGLENDDAWRGGCWGDNE